jgi:glycosyltransferase involved in cell wall biosynthesis
MRIAQVSPLYESCPPQLYGGTERVVSYLTEELVRRGHEVTLFASGDSLTAATLVSPCAKALRLEPACRDPLAHHIVLLNQVMQRADSFDILHFHTDYLHFPLVKKISDKVLTTLHGRLDIPDLANVYREFPGLKLVSISDAQRLPLPDANWVETVHHGLPMDLYSPGAGDGGYLAFLGRMSPEKRPDRAIAIARKAGLPLKIAAKIDKADTAYFDRHICPLLDHPLIEFVGEIGEKDKRTFLGTARALLFPIDWPEPFGLVMIEAMAHGTPVIAWANGSVPEVIEDGLSGFLVDSIDAAVSAVGRLDTLSRAIVRACFERRFSAGCMADQYLRIYRDLLGGDARSAQSLDRSATRRRAA